MFILILYSYKVHGIQGMQVVQGWSMQGTVYKVFFFLGMLYMYLMINHDV